MLRHKEVNADRKLKVGYGYVLLGILAVQIGIADWVFIEYARRGVHWQLSNEAIKAWLAATVVEVIGMTLIVTRHLFPRRDRQKQE